MTALYLDNLDVKASYGLQIAESTGARHMPSRRLDTVPVPEVHGVALLAEPAIEARSLTLVGWLAGSTAIDVRTKRDALLAVLRRGRVTLRFGDAPTRELVVEITSCNVASAGAQQLARTFPVTIECVALDPYWRDTTLQSIALSVTPVALPLGTAPVAPVITVSAPGTVMSITLRTTLGAIVTQLQLAGLEVGLPVTIDCAARTIRQGAVSMLPALISGDFPVLDVVRQGDFAASAWPTLALSQSVGVIQYARRWA